MAEKSIRIADDASVVILATRDAIELDAGSNARVIERVDIASGKFDTPRGSAIRGDTAAITSADGVDLTS